MKPRNIIIIAVIVIIVAGVVFLYAEKPMVYAELNSLKLIPQPETFTELYFDNASYLPRKTVANQPISFSFSIHNVEATTTVYPYEVYFIDASTSYRSDIADGTVTLPNDASTTIPISYTFNASNLTGEVVVNLPSLDNQSIDFLVPDNN